MKHILTDITKQKFDKITSEIEQRTGVTLPGNSGNVEFKGFEVRFHFAPTEKTLELELLKKPWYVPQSLIDSKIKEFMAGPGTNFLDNLG